MTVVELLTRLRLSWKLVALAVALGVGFSVVLARQVDPVYEARSTVLIRPTAAPHGVATHDGARYAVRQAALYRTFVQQREVLTPVVERLGLDLSPGQLRRRVTAESPDGSSLIVVVARSGDPGEAARLASTVAESLTEAVARAEGAGGAGDEEGEVDGRLIATVTSPGPVEPRLELYLAAGLLAGAALGIGGAPALGHLLAGRAAGRRDPHGPAGRLARSVPDEPGPHRPSAAHVVWLLLVAASVPWRRDVYFEGGLDAVVILKAGLSVAGLALAWWLGAPRDRAHPVPAAPVLLMVGYLSVTVVGGLANGTLTSALVVALRVAILGAGACLLVRAYGARRASVSLLHVLGAVAAAAALTGLPGMTGRLFGGTPPLHPNGLAAITGIVCVWLVSRVLSGTDRWWHLAAIGVGLGVILLTGSRTTLAVLALACLVMLPRAVGVRRSSFLSVVLALPALAYVLLGTDLVTAVILRGGEEQVATFSNRLIAWQAAFGTPRGGWETWFGQGLAQKYIPVQGTWWDAQLLDSSWASAWVQGGILGLGLVVILAARTLAGAALQPRREGSLWLGLSVFSVALGVMESGLFDASVPFLVLFVSALAVGARAERR